MHFSQMSSSVSSFRARSLRLIHLLPKFPVTQLPDQGNGNHDHSYCMELLWVQSGKGLATAAGETRCLSHVSCVHICTATELSRKRGCGVPGVKSFPYHFLAVSLTASVKTGMKTSFMLPAFLVLSHFPQEDITLGHLGVFYYPVGPPGPPFPIQLLPIDSSLSALRRIFPSRPAAPPSLYKSNNDTL